LENSAYEGRIVGQGSARTSCSGHKKKPVKKNQGRRIASHRKHKKQREGEKRGKKEEKR